MNRFVAASASSGSMKTLLPRHSTLNSELPAATCSIGSPTSITVRWLRAVSSRVIRVRALLRVREYYLPVAHLAPPRLHTERLDAFSPNQLTVAPVVHEHLAVLGN